LHIIQTPFPYFAGNKKTQSTMNAKHIYSILVSILFVLSFTFESHAQTILNGGEISGVLAKSGSPYQIIGDLLVPKDSVLTIEAGVEMNFDAARLMRIDGVLKVNGTTSEEVVFTCKDSMAGWMGIFLVDNDDQDTTKFNHAFFEYINYPANVWDSPLFETRKHTNGRTFAASVITGYGAAPIIFNSCKFHRCWRVCEIFETHIELIKCQSFRNALNFSNYTNGHFGDISKSYFKISNCHFYNNDHGPLYCGGNLNFSDPGIIENCIFENNWFEITIGNSRVPIRNCTWKNNKCQVLGLGGYLNIEIENCVFDATYGSCPGGGDIRVFGDASESVVKNCIFKNKSSYITSATIDGGSPTFESCIFRDNIYGPYLAPGSTDGRFVNCLFTGNQLSLPAASDVTVINSSFVNNIHQIKDPNNAAVVDSASGAAVSTGGKFTFYNTLFWGNTDYFGRINNFTIRTGQTDH
jgi:hypothetical protein